MEGISKEELLKRILELEDFTEIKFGIINSVTGDCEILNIAKVDNQFLVKMKIGGIPVGYVVMLGRK